MQIANLTELMNMAINIDLSIDGIMKELKSDYNPYFNYFIAGHGNLNDSLFNTTNYVSISESLSIIRSTFHAPLSVLSIDSNSKLFKNNQIHFSNYQNIIEFTGYSLIEYNNFVLMCDIKVYP